MSRHKVLNTPAIRRMPTYYHKLLSMQAQGETFASTSTLAAYMSTDPIVVRKDFELTGVTGSRGVGYRINDLICAIRTYLGWDRSMRACLIGAGSLGTALLGFHEFTDEYGLDICDVFDVAPARIGQTVYGRTIRNMDQLEQVLQERKPAIEMAILCIPADSAQQTAERIVAAGIHLIWNFSNTCLQLPQHVIVQREVIAGGFALLSRKRLEHA